LSHSTFDSNEAEAGGTMYITGTTTITDCRLANSFTSQDGVAVRSIASVMISDSIVAGCDSSSETASLFFRTKQAMALSSFSTRSNLATLNYPYFTRTKTTSFYETATGSRALGYLTMALPVALRLVTTAPQNIVRTSILALRSVAKTRTKLSFHHAKRPHLSNTTDVSATAIQMVC
jgi:hypothetical protein